MKILIGHGSCKITFEENEKYFGKILLIKGEGNLDKEFCVYKSQIHEMCWTDSSSVEPNRFVWVEDTARDEVLSYVMEEAKKEGYSIVLW